MDALVDEDLTKFDFWDFILFLTFPIALVVAVIYLSFYNMLRVIKGGDKYD